MSKLLEAIKAKKQAIAAKNGRERPVKLASAKNLIRLLPNWAGDADGTFSQDYGQHFIKDKNEVIQAVYICTAVTFGKPCAVCAAIAQHSADLVDEDLAKVLSEAKPSSRVLVNAIYMSGPHPNAKTDPVLLELPVSVFESILGIMETYLEDHDINILDLNEGYDLVIGKTGTGRDTKYTVTPSPKPRKIEANVLEKARDLTNYASQEYDAGLQKAIQSLGAVMGGAALPAPSRDRPALAGSSAKSHAETLADTSPVDMDTLEGEFEEVIPEPEAEAAPPATKPATKPASKPAPVPAANDVDLDDVDALLAELENAA